MPSKPVLSCPFILFLLALLLTNCKSTNISTKTKKAPIKIAFGSCSKSDVEQPLWEDIIADEPDIWIWLGDNIYGDTEDMTELRRKYQQQKAKAGYQKLLAKSTILGVWDDHDYGANDAGKEYPKKVESQRELLDFLDASDYDERRERPGIYYSQEFRKKGLVVKIILLDTRYFRDPLLKEGKDNVPDPTGEILGAAQWAWLEQELKNSQADVHIIASSIQVIPVEHTWEKWANFPTERTRLFNLIKNLEVKMPIFISGDRHSAEISKIDWEGTRIFDITSSSLTHTRSNRNGQEELNQYRIGEMIYDDENYGLISISQNEGVQVDVEIKTEENEVLLATIIR